MDPRLPQDLVGEEVPNARDERLIHEGRLDPAAPSFEQLHESASVDAQRIRAELYEQRLDICRVSREPQASELPHVPVADLATVEDEYHAIVPVPAVGVSGPLDVSGHTEVDQRARAVGPRDEPLAPTLRLVEPTAAERIVQLVGRHVSQDPR